MKAKLMVKMIAIVHPSFAVTQHGSTDVKKIIGVQINST